jgi:hypothetical protein
MGNSQWHRFYKTNISSPPAVLFELLSDLPNYGRWLPRSAAYAETTEVTPYPVQLGSRYQDGKPAEPGRNWWGSVIGFQPPGSIDFHQVIHVGQLRATAEVHIHYSIERDGPGTLVNRWLLLDITMPGLLRPLRPLMTARFEKENARMMDALKAYAEAHPEGVGI